MPIVIICDADRKTVLTAEEAQRAGWGLVRFYGPDAIQAVDEFSTEMLAAAKEARELFKTRTDEAREKFRELYPDGLLPDEEEKKDEERSSDD